MKTTKRVSKRLRLPQEMRADAHTLELLGQPFVLVGIIQPKTEKDDTPCTYMPQERYPKAKQKPLNSHGAGPFCRIAVP